LSETAAEEHIHGICFKTGPPGRVGVELEWLVRVNGDAAAPAGHERVTRALAELTEAGELPGGGRLTIEPGGQVEISSAPATGIGSCVTQAGRDLAAVREALRGAGLTLAGLGVDPYRLPARVLDLPRYAAMEQFFDRGGPWGRVMMCSTASVQVCVDAGCDDDGYSGFRWRWRLLHALGPVLVAAFANSPLRAGRLTGWKSTRQAVWAQLDPGRTRAPAGAEPQPGGYLASRNGTDRNSTAGHDAGRSSAVGNGASPDLAGHTTAGPSRSMSPASNVSNGSTSSRSDVARPDAGGAGGAAGVSDGDSGGRTGQGRWGAAAPGWPPNPRGPGHGEADGAGHRGTGHPGRESTARDSAMLAGPGRGRATGAADGGATGAADGGADGAAGSGAESAGRDGAGGGGADRPGNDSAPRGGALLDGADVPAAANPRAAWAEYALDAQVMCVRRDDGQNWSAPPGLTFRDWLRGHGCEERLPTQADLAYHLSTLFPPVRPQGHLEVRFIDAQPGDGWIVPAAVVSALTDDPVAAQQAMAAAEPAWRGAGRDVAGWDGPAIQDGSGPPGPWLRAARLGLADPVLARAARDCFEAADAALGRVGAPPEIRRRVTDFAEEYVLRGRCPADDTLEELR
jgi:gamma-glutamylcysteine synthetase